MKIDLFQTGKFISHAGLPLNWKIECDAISRKEWECLAEIIMEYETRSFSKVIGIPEGGRKLARPLEKYAKPESFINSLGDIVHHPILIVDDVYTTGTSFKQQIDKSKLEFNEWFGWVAFARNPIIGDRQGYDSGDIKALFQMP